MTTVLLKIEKINTTNILSYFFSQANKAK